MATAMFAQVFNFAFKTENESVTYVSVERAFQIHTPCKQNFSVLKKLLVSCGYTRAISWTKGGYLYVIGLYLKIFSGIGVAAKELKDPILGEDSFSYAVQIHQHPKIACSNTSNKIVLKKSNTDAEMKIIGIRINMESHWMDVYFHGTLPHALSSSILNIIIF